MFNRDGEIYRRVNTSYAEHYDALVDSGLLEQLVDRRLLVGHEEVSSFDSPDPAPHRTLRPERISFISYPYEWSFSQLKDAALTTLEIHDVALRHGMTLKDATPYNIQFRQGRAIFIDTLSFERYVEGSSWVAYRQFCQGFLAPLALMAMVDVRLGQMLRVHLDGVPLDLASAMLPARTWLVPALLLHLHMHARYQTRYKDAGAVRPDGTKAGTAPSVRPMSKTAQIALIDGIRRAIQKLTWTPAGTEWADYYSAESYQDQALADKKTVVQEMLGSVEPGKVWDIGANTGVYSRLAAEAGHGVISFDVDPACVEQNYRIVREKKEPGVLPLLLDLVNPPPGSGWAHEERESLADRADADVVLALALVHHIAISNNVPLRMIAEYFARLAPKLIIEFVPKSDPKAATLLATRDDVFPSYTQDGFEEAFGAVFDIEESRAIRESQRVLYRMTRRLA